MSNELKSTHVSHTELIKETITAGSIDDAINQISVILKNVKLEYPLENFRLQVFGFAQSITVPIDKVID